MLDQFKVKYNFYCLLKQRNRLRNRSHVINQGKSIFDRSCVCTIEPIIDYDFFRQLNTLIKTYKRTTTNPRILKDHNKHTMYLQ